MDAGDYLIRVGDSSRNTHVAATINLAAPLVTEQLSNELTDPTPTPQPALTELTSNPANFYSYPREAHETRRRAVDVAEHHRVRDAERRVALPADQDGRQHPRRTTRSTARRSPPRTAYVDPTQKNWEGTGAPYQAKTGETITQVATDPAATLYDVAKGSTTIQQFVAGPVGDPAGQHRRGGQPRPARPCRRRVRPATPRRSTRALASRA